MEIWGKKKNFTFGDCNSNRSEIERKTRIKIKCVKTDERGKRKIIKPN